MAKTIKSFTLLLILVSLATACGSAQPTATLYAVKEDLTQTSLPPTIEPPQATDVQSELPPTANLPATDTPILASTDTPAAQAAKKQQAKSTSSVEGWAVLAAKEDYSDVGMTDLKTGFLSLYRERALLDYFGWQDDHILELRDEVDQQKIRGALDWLASNADQDDIVLFHINGHGKFLRENLDWGNFFAEEWGTIPSQRRVLIVDSCTAGEFTATTVSDPAPLLSIAAVAADEYGWAGLWEEGLPIIGGVFSHYLLSAFTDPTADTDHDGLVSIQEATLMAEGKQRTYMHEVVFSVPEFLAMYTNLGSSPNDDPTFPDVIIEDSIGEPVYLSLDAYR